MKNTKIELSEESAVRFWDKIAKKSDDECWEWLAGKSKGGYGQVKINNKTYLTHRISWILHNGEIPEHNSFHGMCVCHTCDNRACVNPSHLFLGTNNDNTQDMIKKERNAQPQGEQHGCHKLTEKEVIEIREKYIPRKYSARKLAKEYGVYHSTILRIVKHVIWGHVI